MKDRPARARAVPRRAVLSCLLALFAVAGFFSLRRESATFDETAHLPAGFTYLDRLDFRHNPEHPPLAKMWAALPVWILHRRAPDYASPDWVGVHEPPSDPQRSRANQWSFGYRFLNGGPGEAARLDPREALVPARSAMLLLGVLLGLVVWAWARDLWGDAGGLVALALYVLSPPVLAHARLVTTDAPAALGVVASLWLFARVLRRPSWGRAALLGLAVGGALLTKFSTVLLAPCFAALLVWWWIRPGATDDGGPPRRGRIVAALAGAAALALIVLWAGYGFRFAASADPGYRLEWEAVRPGDGAAARLVLWARDHRVLPEAWLYGFGLASRFSQARLAFFHGQESLTGWWYWFPAALLLKTPLAFLGLLGWLARDGLRARRGIPFSLAVALVPAAIHLVVAMATRLNIGHRHLLVLYPLLCVAGGAAAGLFRQGRARALAAGALLAGCAASFALASPGYLAYFNVLAGGSRGGWRWLVDSNIDWGQDLPALARWMRTEGVPRVHLAYFGTADPSAYGIEFEKVALVHDFHPEKPASRPRPGDVLAVSVTLLQGVYLDRDGRLYESLVARGWAAPAAAREFRALRDAALARGEEPPAFRTWVVDRGLVTAEQVRVASEGLLTTWLDGIREGSTPIARAGDSILIYRIP